MATIKIVGWNEFQHYSKRRPPWIKLHRSLLEKRKWIELSGDASKLLVNLWIVASEYDEGEITKPVADLAWAFRIPDPQLVTKWLNELQDKGFIELSAVDASKVLASCKQDATPEESRVQRQSSEVRDRKENSPDGEKKKKRGAQLPDEWRPNALHRQLAESKKVDIALEYDRFRDHAASVGRVCKDWDAAFRNWIRKAAEFARNGRPPADSEASRIRNELPGKGRQGTSQMHRMVSEGGTHYWDDGDRCWKVI